MGSGNSKDQLRSSIIDELITADSWFALVPERDIVKVFSCTDRDTLKRALVTMMLKEEQYASVIVDAMEEYVRVMSFREINTINLN